MAGTAELWFRRTYRLPPSDERYLSLTRLDILAEYFAYHYDDLIRDGKEVSFEEFDDPDFDLDKVLEQMAREGDNWEKVIG